jgi:hypothetical protein
MEWTTFLEAIATHLSREGWRVADCERCGHRFFSQSAETLCGRPECMPTRKVTPAGSFRLVRFWDEIWPRIRDHFVAAGFTLTNRSDIVNRVGDTMFLSAGLQIFNDAIYGKGPILYGALFVPQPVIRLNYFEAVGRVEGVSTSFVNLCTEQAQSSLGDYLWHLEVWLDCLTRVGIQIKRLTLLAPSDPWIKARFTGHRLIFYSNGVELGDAIFIHHVDALNSLAPIIDFSFGLERLTWVLNGGKPYSLMLGPLPFAALPDNTVVLDRLRTATLMVLSGVTPSSRRHGRLLRRLISDAARLCSGVDFEEVVEHSYSYWQSFITPTISLSQCRDILRQEFVRAKNVVLARVLGAPVRPSASYISMPTDAFCRLLLRHQVNLGQLAEGAAKIWPAVSLAQARSLHTFSYIEGQASRTSTISANELPKLVTILTPTSPIPSHPSTVIIERAIKSLGAKAGLTGCRHLIVCDGCPDDAPLELRERYEEYKQTLRRLADEQKFCTAVEIVELPACVGLSGVIRAGIPLVKTPYVLVYEHDWEIVRHIDTLGILLTFEKCPDVQYVRLNKRHTIESGWDWVLKPDTRSRPVPLVRTSCWSANPHFARIAYYMKMILPRIADQPGGGTTGFEHPLFYAYQEDIRTLGFDRAQQHWGVFIYGKLGDPPVVRHLDGRGTLVHPV